MTLKQVLSYVPLAIGITVLLVGVAFVPWSKVGPYFLQLNLLHYVLILALGVSFYLIRILRYSYILNQLNESRVSLRRVGLGYIMGQPISLIPGGELYRSVLLKKYANISMKNSVPTVFVQSLTEGFGLVALSLIGAMIIGKYVLVVAGVAVLYGAVVSAIQLHQTGRRSHSFLNRIPFVSVSRRMIRSFLGKNKKILRGGSFFVLMASSVLSTFMLVGALLVAANAFNIELSFTEAIIAASLPIILQFVTFLPGGIGVNEQGSVGILLLMQVPLPAAVALTIVVRFISLWLGLLLGAIAISYVKLSSNEKS